MMESDQALLAVVVPVHNEGRHIEEFVASMDAYNIHWKHNTDLIVVDDGSSDNISELLATLSPKNIRLVNVRLSRRFGKESAILAGIDRTEHDAVIVMDGDFEHPLEYIQQMLDTWKNGAQVVRMRRTQRDVDPLWRRLLTRWFYKFILPMSNIDQVDGVGDFCLLDRCVVDAIQKLPERNRIFKGLVSWCGFDTATVDYFPGQRVHGRSRWGIASLVRLGFIGITSFSNLPLKVWTAVGTLLVLSSIICVSYFLYLVHVVGAQVSTLSYLVSTVIFLGGIQLICLGILGEYIAKIYTEVRHRPNYLVNERGTKLQQNELSEEQPLSAQAVTGELYSMAVSASSTQGSREITNTAGKQFATKENK
jgi:glycosyltransferase involved in cell wall biosynthesis